jgi:hypothetical protein
MPGRTLLGLTSTTPLFKHLTDLSDMATATLAGGRIEAELHRNLWCGQEA